ncbi:MAG: hypothetical protein IT170_18860 [Bryobacterales bacterium]|nr:hypothetical protein [Bryobacterales bacterium]
MQGRVAAEPQVTAQLHTAFQSLISHCRESDWAGHDPYDALNSRLFEKLRFLDRRVPRLILTQLLRRSPVNLRSALDIPKTQNPKALALFVSAFTKMTAGGRAEHAAESKYLIERLEALRSPDNRYWCWGYSFPWQTRTVIVPSLAPNLVCTTFVGAALLDAYECYGDPKCLTMAVSAAEYIIDQLYWRENGSVAGFAYPLPTVRSRVHNANFLAAALLCRVGQHTGDRRFMAPALAATRFSASRQNDDGSWPYGDGPFQSFVDNFHTGFNLCALRVIMRHLPTDEFEANVRRGFRYYCEKFYLQSGAVRYFNDRTYPIDIHAVAQSIITPTALCDPTTPGSELALSVSVFRWAMKHMWNARGYFYYRILRSGTIRIPYMRWSQAWMAFAMAQLHWNLTLREKARGSALP